MCEPGTLTAPALPWPELPRHPYTGSLVSENNHCRKSGFREEPFSAGHRNLAVSIGPVDGFPVRPGGKDKPPAGARPSYKPIMLGLRLVGGEEEEVQNDYFPDQDPFC
jgi:hypothetical protein